MFRRAGSVSDRRNAPTAGGSHSRRLRSGLAYSFNKSPFDSVPSYSQGRVPITIPQPFASGMDRYSDGAAPCRASSTTSKPRSCPPSATPLRSPTARTTASATSTCAAGARSIGSSKRGKAARGTAAGCSSACSRCRRTELHAALGLGRDGEEIDQATAIALKRKLAQEFRDQLTVGAPTNEDEAGLRRLARQLAADKVVVKLFLRHPLHAKLYLHFRPDPVNPMVGYLGSSNLTFAGLARQGELNVDVLDHDACDKLARWFEDRWNDHFCIDISKELVDIIDASWARPEPIPPYHIYIKMAYHLSQEALAGLSRVPHPRRLRRHAVRVPEGRGQDRRPPPEQARRGAHRRRGRPRQDAHGHRPGPHLRGRPRPRNADPLPEEPRAHVGGLRASATACAAKVLSLTRATARTARPAALPARADRRKPQPAQPRGAALPGHRRLHPQERQPRDPALGHAVQQDLPRPVEPAAGCSSTTGRTWASGRSGSSASWARRNSPPPPDAPRARWRRSRRAATPTTGAT